MYYSISIEDLVANALIEIVERTGKRTVYFSQLNNYGNAIIEKLKSKNIEAILILNKDATNRFFHNCSDIFIISETASDVSVTLKNNYSANDLRKRFRINIALQLLEIFISEEIINILMEQIEKT